jgi:hypothetical protein
MTTGMKHLGGLLALAVLLAGPARAQEPESAKPGGTKGMPLGWFVTQSAPNLYEAGVDTSSPCEGSRSAFLRSRTGEPAGYGTFMQAFGAKDFRGKRLRFSAMVRVKNVDGWAGLWMRVEGTDPKQPLGFDNMQSRSLGGTQGCKRYDVVLDVPTEATTLMAGLLLSGAGQAWLDGVRFEVVDASVPVTDLLAARVVVPSEGPHGLEEREGPAHKNQLPTGQVGQVWFNLGRVNMEQSYTRQGDGVWRSILSEEIAQKGQEVTGTFQQRKVVLKVKTEGARTLIEGKWGGDAVRIQMDPERLTMKWGIYERELVRVAAFKEDPNCLRYQRVEGPRVTDRMDVCGAALSNKPPAAQLVLAFLGNGFRRVPPYTALPLPTVPVKPRDAMSGGTSKP